MARRRSALPESAAAGAIQTPRCLSCDAPSGEPAFLCPDCPKRMARRVPAFDHGWAGLHERDPELCRVMIRNAKAARQLAITREDHPAYAEIEREYIAAGMELMALHNHQNGWEQPEQVVGWIMRNDRKTAARYGLVLPTKREGQAA